MDFRRECESYQEEGGKGGMGLQPNPPLNSCHNTLLFSAVKMAILGRDVNAGDLAWFGSVVSAREIKPGLYSRLIGVMDLVAHDDLIGVASVSMWRAAEILRYGESHGWKWGDRFLGRMPIFIPALRVFARARLSLLQSLMLAGCFIANLFEPKMETSGKVLLWLVSRKHDAWYVRLWRNHVNIGDAIRIYYGESHPFSRAMVRKSVTP